MKIKSFLFTVLLFCNMYVLAQHPLVGTWELLSIKGVDAEGNKISANTSTNREIKIITPTHYMLIAQDVKGDSLIFSRCHAGTVHLEGNKYIETPTTASWEPLGNVVTDFTWKVEGDKFIQSGTVTLDDGKKIMLDELVFQKVKQGIANPKNPIVGTWDQLSSSFTLPDGTKDSHTNATTTRFYVFTPTHWMMIGHRDKKFESASGGTYTMKNNKMDLTLTVASYPIDNSYKYEISQRVVGDKLYVNGIRTAADGKKLTWDDVFQKVSGSKGSVSSKK